jgi:hypothetical protein
MLTSYFKPGESKNFYKAILDTRLSCDRYELSSLTASSSSSSSTAFRDLFHETTPPKNTLDDYMFVLEELRTQTLSECERNDQLLPADNIPFPIVPPESVVRSRFM